MRACVRQRVSVNVHLAYVLVIISRLSVNMSTLRHGEDRTRTKCCVSPGHCVRTDYVRVTSTKCCVSPRHGVRTDYVRVTSIV